MKEYLLNNTHKTILIVEPVENLAERKEKCRLEKYMHPNRLRKKWMMKANEFKQSLKRNSTNYSAHLMMMSNGGFYVYTEAY